jgi:predicted ATPase
VSTVGNDDAVIRFAAFQLQPAQRQLTRNGVPVQLGARAMDLLLHLTAHTGTIVGKQALMKAVWPDRIVEENNLTVNMAALRKALGNTADGQPMIQTVTGRGYVFIGAAVEAPPPAIAPPAPPPLSSLPQPATRLIGRDTAVAEVQALLQTRRIVSIVGPGGVGKTILALHVAAELAPALPDGAAFVDLSTITDPARVPEAVAAVVAGGAGTNTATARLTAVLRDHKSLLVLDNCEHVVEPVAALVGAIVSGCPGVAVLVTSREGLFLGGEQIFRLPPLTVPEDPAKVDAAGALRHGAVRLFVERADALGGFTLDDRTAPAVAAICARLDGIPLAIEMAVPRLKVLSPAQLAERLDERFRLLAAPGRGTTPRHRTLQAVIDWSYDYLPAEERTVLRCLSAFSGAANLAAVAAVANDGANNAGGDDVELLDRLTALADKSLLTVDATAAPRFRLLETVRQYASRKAVEAGETSLARRHAAYFADLFDEAARLWPTMSGREWLATYAVDAENMRSALGWAFGPEGDAEIGVRLVAGTVPLWWELPETPVAEGQRWLATAAGSLRPETPPAVRGWINFGQSWRDFRFSDRENLQGALDAVAQFREAGDASGLGAALWRAASALLTQETIDQAEAYLIEAEAVLRGIAPGKWLALTLVRLGDLHHRRGRYEAALASYQEGFDLSRSTDFWIGLVNGGSNMAEVMLTTGEGKRALQQLKKLRDELPPSRRTPLMATLTRHLLLADDIPATRQAALETVNQGSAIGLTAAVGWTAEATALLAAMEGKLDQAARLAGYARAVHPSLATRAGSPKEVVGRLQPLLAKLPPEALKSGLAEGGRWTLATAADRIRQVLGDPGP